MKHEQHVTSLIYALADLAIAEGTVPIISPMYARGGGGMAMDAASTPVETGSTTVAVDVQVTYELR